VALCLARVAALKYRSIPAGPFVHVLDYDPEPEKTTKVFSLVFQLGTAGQGAVISTLSSDKLQIRKLPVNGDVGIRHHGHNIQ
jgi:hypothetical protein